MVLLYVLLLVDVFVNGYIVGVMARLARVQLMDLKGVRDLHFLAFFYLWLLLPDATVVIVEGMSVHILHHLLLKLVLVLIFLVHEGH